MIISILFLLVLLPQFNVLGQEQHKVVQKNTYRRYTLKDGLPQIQVTHLMQDCKGYIWVSHWNGISRFNGYEFERIPQNEKSFSAPAFHAVEFKPDQIAIIGFEGITLKSSDKYEKVLFPDHVIGDRNAYFYPFGDKWMITNLVLQGSRTEERRHFVFDPENLTFKESLPLAGTFIREVIPKKQDLFIYSDTSYFRVRKDFSFFEERRWNNFYDDFALSPQNDCYAYCRDKNRIFRIKIEEEKAIEVSTKFEFSGLNETFRFNRFAITAEHKVVWFDNDYELFVTDTLSTAKVGRRFGLIRNFMNDRYGNLWLATEEGVFNFFKFQFQTTKIFPEEFSDMVWSIAQTKGGEMLFSTLNRGLYKQKGAVVKKVDLMPFRFNGEDAVNLDKGYISTFRDDNGEVFIPFKNSLLQWDASNTITRLPIDGNIEMFVKDEKSRIIYGAVTGGLLKIDPDRTIQKIEKGFGAYQNESIAIDKFRRIWLGSSRKKYVQIYDDESVTCWSDSLLTRIIAMNTDARKNIWFGNHEGVFLYDYETVTKILPEIIVTPIYNIIPYNDSLMVLAGSDELYMINTNRYYAGAKNAMYRHAPCNGFTAEECVQNSYCIADDGALWIPATDYCYRLYPLQLASLPTIEQPFIERVEFAGKKNNWVLLDALSKPSVTKRNLSISFIIPNHNQKDYLRYRHRLIGYQDQWSVPTSERKAVFENLPPGKFRFEVQASIDNMNWSESAFSEEVAFPKRFTESVLFIVLLFLVFGSIVFLMAKKYFTHQRKKAIQQQENHHRINNLQLAGIKSHLNPHFIFNVMNAVGSDIMRNKKEAAYDYFVALSQLIRESLDDTHKPLKTLAQELAFVEQYIRLQRYRFGDKLVFRKQIADDINIHRIIVPRMSVQLLVENSIKHGLEPQQKTGVIVFSAHRTSNQIILCVSDNGKGFRDIQSSTHSGKGLSSLHQIFTIYNHYNTQKATLDITSQESGSTVAIHIPNQYNFNLNNQPAT